MAITATTSKQAFIDLLNKDNSTSLTTSDITVADAAELTPVEGTRNAKAVVTAAEGSEYAGDVTLKFRRLTATEVFGQPSIIYTVVGADTTIEQAQAAFEAHLKADFNLPFEDGSYSVVASPLTGDPDGAAYSLAVTFDKHYITFGALTVKVKLSNQQLSEVITVTDLAGFEPDDLADPE